jgi:hypothetical protein
VMSAWIWFPCDAGIKGELIHPPMLTPVEE